MSNGKGFENHIDELRSKNFEILWRQDWFIVEKFKHMAQSPYNYSDQNRFKELVLAGMEALKADDIDNLRGVVAQLGMMQIGSVSETQILDIANIVRG